MLTKGILVLLLIGVACGGLLVSLITLTVGLIRDRRRVWRLAIAPSLFFLALLVGSSVWGAMKVFRTAQHAIEKKLAEDDAARQGSPERMREWFESITNVKLPPEAVYVNGRQVDELNFSNYFLQFRIPASYGATLQSNFEPAAWADVQAALTPWSKYYDWRSELPFWDVSKMQGKTYYQKLMKDKAGVVTFNVSICVDPNTNLVSFVAMEVHD